MSYPLKDSMVQVRSIGNLSDYVAAAAKSVGQEILKKGVSLTWACFNLAHTGVFTALYALTTTEKDIDGKKTQVETIEFLNISKENSDNEYYYLGDIDESCSILADSCRVTGSISDAIDALKKQGDYSQLEEKERNALVEQDHAPLNLVFKPIKAVQANALEISQRFLCTISVKSDEYPKIDTFQAGLEKMVLELEAVLKDLAIQVGSFGQHTWTTSLTQESAHTYTSLDYLFVMRVGVVLLSGSEGQKAKMTETIEKAVAIAQRHSLLQQEYLASLADVVLTVLQPQDPASAAMKGKTKEGEASG